MENPECAFDDLLILSSSTIFALSLLSTTFLYGLNIDLELTEHEKNGIIVIYIALILMLAYYCEKILKKSRICKNFFRSQYSEDESSPNCILNSENDASTEHVFQNSEQYSKFPSKYFRRYSFPMQSREELYFSRKSLSYNEVSIKPLNQNIFKSPQYQSSKIPNGTVFRLSSNSSVLRNSIKSIDDIIMKVKYLNEMYKNAEEVNLGNQVSTLEFKELDLCPDFKKKDVADPYQSHITNKLDKFPDVTNTFYKLHPKITEDINFPEHSIQQNTTVLSNKIISTTRHRVSGQKRKFIATFFNDFTQEDKSESNLVPYALKNGFVNLPQRMHQFSDHLLHETGVNECFFLKDKENNSCSKILMKDQTNELHLKSNIDDINVNGSINKIYPHSKTVFVHNALNNQPISLETKPQTLSDVSTTEIEKETSKHRTKSFHKLPQKIPEGVNNSEQSIRKSMTVSSNHKARSIKHTAPRFCKKKEKVTSSFKDIPQNHKSKSNQVLYTQANQFKTVPQKTQENKLSPTEDLHGINESLGMQKEYTTSYSQSTTKELSYESYTKPYVDNLNVTGPFIQTPPLYKSGSSDHFSHHFRMDDLSEVKNTPIMSYRRNRPQNFNRKLQLEYKTGINDNGPYLLKLPKLKFTFFSLIQKVSGMNVEQKHTCEPPFESKSPKSQTDMPKHLVKECLANIPMRRSKSEYPKKRCEPIYVRNCYKIMSVNFNEQPISLEAEPLSFENTSTIKNERPMDTQMISMFLPIFSRDLPKISMDEILISDSEANALEAEPLIPEDSLISSTEEEIPIDMSIISMILPKVSFDLTKISFSEV